MRPLIHFLTVGSILLLLNSCAVKKDYEVAVTLDSIPVYEEYLRKFPNRKYSTEVKQRLEILYHDKAWKRAVSQNSIAGYENYLINYNNGKYVENARKRIREIEKQNEIDKAWRNTRSEHTIRAYETFLKYYPETKYSYDAKSYIRKIEEQNLWTIASDKNDIKSYEAYLEKFPLGKYSLSAKNQIEKLKEENIMLPLWKETKWANTYKGYADFLAKYPYSKYASEAKRKMGEIEKSDWDWACLIDSVSAYENYNTKYPNGKYIRQSEKKIIDLEVDNIFKGDYGKLPPMTKTSNSYYTNNNSVEIHNSTRYTLTVRYSGNESIKIVLAPGQKTTKTIKNGSYRVTASVDAAYVRNYAGTDNLTGGEYSNKFYIK